MGEIRTVGIVGMGALGILQAKTISDCIGREQVLCIMNRSRYEKHRNERYLINGEETVFRLVPSGAGTDTEAQPLDLIIMGIKYGGLEESLEEMAPFVGDNTTIISMMNGIICEDILAERFGREKVLDCIALGMDAERVGTVLTYTHPGRLQIGASAGEDRERLDRVSAFFDKTGVPYELPADIRHAMWKKLQLNVGINQICMIRDVGYGAATEEGSENLALMRSAMDEVRLVGEKEGILLTEAEREDSIALMRTLDPEAGPSMYQDRRAGRLSEVELFAGTVLKLGRRHGISTPVNQMIYDTVKQIEAAY